MELKLQVKYLSALLILSIYQVKAQTPTLTIIGSVIEESTNLPLSLPQSLLPIKIPKNL